MYFAKLEDTQVPALQNWALELTIPGRKNAILSNIRSTGDKFERIKSATEHRLNKNSGRCHMHPGRDNLTMKDIVTEYGVCLPNDVFLQLEQVCCRSGSNFVSRRAYTASEMFTRANNAIKTAIKQHCAEIMHYEHENSMNMVCWTCFVCLAVHWSWTSGCTELGEDRPPAAQPSQEMDCF